MPRLVRSSPGTGGYTRRRAGTGFTYRGANGHRITDPATLERFRDLAIPPAWTQVWIAREDNAHIQATGVDDAGRTQYLYHPRWRDLRDAEKFERARSFAEALPSLRRRVTRDLRATGEAAGRRRALAAAVRLMDRGSLRVGGSEHSGQTEAFGATTLQRRHVRREGTSVHLVFRGKSGGAWDVTWQDADLVRFFTDIPATPRTAPAICYPVRSGRRKQWKGISAADVNHYLTEGIGREFTAKDFRTWQGSVAAARSLARSHRAGLPAPEAVKIALQAAADLLQNTPTVAGEAYVDPRIMDLFGDGQVVELRQQPDRGLLRLLARD
ncbi:DNA topoisomerase IB [Cellulosimicrobium funkei]|nr:DNA topoisomerase IB [Cellulosimicrobium funkei]